MDLFASVRFTDERLYSQHRCRSLRDVTFAEKRPGEDKSRFPKGERGRSPAIGRSTTAECACWGAAYTFRARRLRTAVSHDIAARRSRASVIIPKARRSMCIKWTAVQRLLPGERLAAVATTHKAYFTPVTIKTGSKRGRTQLAAKFTRRKKKINDRQTMMSSSRRLQLK